MKLRMTKTGKMVLTICNLLLILLLLCGILLLGIGSLSVKRTGTFNLFGYSYHLNKSSTLAPALERNDLVVVKHLPVTEFTDGSLIAFYQQNEDGESDLLIRRLVEQNGEELTVADEEGETAVLSVDHTRFLGVATSKSKRLGHMVLFLQSDSGRSMFLWWTGGIVTFLVGVIILTHILLKGRAEEEPQTQPETPAAPEYQSRHVDWSAFEVKTQPEAPPAEQSAESADEQEAKAVMEDVDRLLTDLEQERKK